MAGPPLEGESTDANVPGVKGTNDAGRGIEGQGVIGISGDGTTTGVAASGIHSGLEGFGNDFGVIGFCLVASNGNRTGVRGEGSDFGVFGHGGRIGGRFEGVENGVQAESDSGDAFVATTNGLNKSAVFASNNGQGDAPSGPDVPPGGNGVFGLTVVNGGAGVFGSNNGSKGRGVQGNGPEVGVGGFSAGGAGVLAQTISGVGILAQGQKAGRFEGNVEVTGAITVDGDVFLRNRDVAEQFGAVGECAPGSVMVIGENALLEPCTREYDKRAVGIISGAGSLRPAITLGQTESDMPTASIAMVGTAFCLVDAEGAPIEVGDLLTSSSTPGHAMKALDHAKGFGAVIGKALAPLSNGRGLVPVVVALQ